MHTKDDILNSNLEVQLKGLYVQIVGEMNAKCLCLLSWYMYIASFANDYGMFSFQNYTCSNFQMFCMSSNGKLRSYLNLCPFLASLLS
jgi:hypothetical protein